MDIMKLLKVGAEAKIFLSEYLGRKCVVKIREHKNYREKSLDFKILKERIRSECALLSKAKKTGVRTPFIWKIGLKGFSITMEFIEGKTLREKLNDKNAANLCAKLGGLVAALHSNDIVHGDLTTSNIIASNDDLVVFDFGLGTFSKKTEDKAVDLLSLKKTFLSTHFPIIGHWGEVEHAYAKNYPQAEEVFKQMENVQSRARYL